MGRRRSNGLEIDGKPVDLPPRVYVHGRKLRLMPRIGKPIILGGCRTMIEYRAAMHKWASLTGEEAIVGTVSALFDWFIRKIKADKVLAPRTIKDYAGAGANIKAGLGHIPDNALTAGLVTEWRDLRARDAPVRANREVAALGACYTAAIGTDRLKMLHPCRGVKRITEHKRTRYIADAEYWDVHKLAVPSVRIMMALVYRTLQRIEDLMQAGPANVKTVAGHRVLRIEQGKTGTTVDIELMGELAAIVDAHLAQTVVRRTFVHAEDGEPYSYDGLASMFRRYVKGAGSADFGMYDLKGKGATDMFIAGVPIRTVQLLCGHANPSMTERYIKARLPDRVAPNLQEIQQAG